MNILYIDTCNSPLYVSVISDNNDKIIAKSNRDASRKYNSLLLPMIDDVLTEVGIKPNDIDAVACVVGAGSFTGIRLGISTAHAFARAVKAKLISISEFEIMVWNKKGRVIAAIDARHDNYYIGEYNDGVLVKMGNATKSELYEYSGEVVYFDNDIDREAVYGVVSDKVKNGLYVQLLEPLYLKESQAEREAKKKANQNGSV